MVDFIKKCQRLVVAALVELQWLQITVCASQSFLAMLTFVARAIAPLT